MPRGGGVVQRETLPDTKYGDRLVGKFVSTLMSKGKKGTAERIAYGAFDLIEKKTSGDPMKIFRSAVDNVKPVVEVKSRRVGGASYQVPVEIRPTRRLSLALRWIAEFARSRSGKSMVEKLAAELIDASNNTGAAVKKREDVHRMAEANKAFAHYRW